MKIYNLLKRKQTDGGATYFCILPTVNIVNQNRINHLYLVWLNVCIVFIISKTNNK